MPKKNTENTNSENKPKTISERELEILEFWNGNKIQEKNLLENGIENKEKYTFYDGPPFATGLPHHGHLLQSYLKDSVPRFQVMNGKSVRRVWGWDCHGLPIENLIEKNLGFKNKSDIEKFGLENFTSAAMNQVLQYEDDWKKIVPRWGRWVDMENRYMTLTNTYTESVWWSFAELYKKDLVYEGYKVMHICPRCETPLAASEVALAYNDIRDISVYVKFELEEEKGTYLLAWTTTPWTLPGNTAVAVNENVTYVKVEYNNEKYILAKYLLEKTFADLYNVISEFKGAELLGKKYIPVFDYYTNEEQSAKIKNYENIYKVWHADFVDTSMGTGIAHEAPAFGEDDYNLSIKNNFPAILHVEMNGNLKPEVTDFAGLPVKKKGDNQSTDKKICEFLANQNKILKTEIITHSYPHCWRCDTPLLNYATNSWFLAVSKIRERLIEENKKVYWIPEHVKEGRMGQWLEGARDWALSRNRYWGAPVPVWKSKVTGEVFVPGSLKDLQSRTKSKNKYIFIRHGETASNVKGQIDVDMENNDPLGENGLAQVRSAAEVLKNKNIDVIISSPYNRTRETAEVIAEVLNYKKEDIKIEDRIKEFQVGVVNEGKTWRDLYAENPDVNFLYQKMAGTEEMKLDVAHRVAQTIYDLENQYEGKIILLVSHASPISMIEMYSSGALYERGTGNLPAFDRAQNAEIVELDFRPLPHNGTGEVDFHVPYIDEVELYDAEGNLMKREALVFDCWYESGSMPYAQFHYPFENQELFKENFPADFIAEAQDQTRGWFYTMMVLGVALFDKSPYKSVICSGHIMAGDGKKLSKSLNNFTNPMELIEQYGSDSLRYYILSSPVVKGENARFTDQGVGDVYRKNVARLLNVISLYKMYTTEETTTSSSSKHVLDQYIIARLKETKKAVAKGFSELRIDEAFRPVESFIDDLSVWYVRRSRERIKSDDKNVSSEILGTLKYVLFEFSKVLAPIMPFTAEMIYGEVKSPYDVESVHLQSWGENSELDSAEAVILVEMEKTRKIISNILEERIKVKQKVRQPLRGATLALSLEIKDSRAAEYFAEILDETNIKSLNFADIEKVQLDTVITEELQIEGAIRELSRSVQDKRKEMKLSPADLVTLQVDILQSDENKDKVKSILTGENKTAADFARQCNLQRIEVSEISEFTNETESQDFLGSKISFQVIF